MVWLPTIFFKLFFATVGYQSLRTFLLFYFLQEFSIVIL